MSNIICYLTSMFVFSLVTLSAATTLTTNVIKHNQPTLNYKSINIDVQRSSFPNLSAYNKLRLIDVQLKSTNQLTSQPRYWYYMYEVFARSKWLNVHFSNWLCHKVTQGLTRCKTSNVKAESWYMVTKSLIYGIDFCRSELPMTKKEIKK